METEAGGEMVLVVDDDASTRFLLSRSLEHMGMRAVEAEDGASVVDLTARQRFSLLVIDLYMGGMNGFEVLRQIRRRDPGLLPAPSTAPDVPILVISGEGQPASIANARALGANAYLVKPLDLDAFEAAVSELTAPRPANGGPQRVSK